MKLEEHEIQKTLMRWVEMAAARHPELHLMHAIPNGGQRNKIVGAKLKAEGVKPGVPDLCLPVARGDHHGLYLEMKTPTGPVSNSQKQWHLDLREQGYRVEVCRSWHYAAAIICTYLTAKDGGNAGSARSGEQ